MNSQYKNQVALLLSILPEVAKEKDLAIHGGTAINLFVRNMPRLSVDIDLTYIPVRDRTTSLLAINEILNTIESHVRKVQVQAKTDLRSKEAKLLISIPGATVKLEVNLTNRGVLGQPAMMELCSKAREAFDTFCAIQVVPAGQLFGGKICAALARQHPRDLFDVKYLLENDGFTDQIKEGFLFLLLCSERPAHELLNPNRIDQRSSLINQFTGMTDETFTYDDYEETRSRLIATVQNGLTEYDKDFLLNFTRLTPDWSVYNFRHFSAVNWKIQNLEKLRNDNPKKFDRLFHDLSKVLHH